MDLPPNENPDMSSISNPVHPELYYFNRMRHEINLKIFPSHSTTIIIDSKYFHLYSDLIESQKTNSKSLNSHSKHPFKQNRLVDNFLFLKRVYLSDLDSVEVFLIFLDLFLINQYRADCKSYSIIAYRLIKSKINDNDFHILDILYQEEMDMIVTYPILEDYFRHCKKSQNLPDNEKERLFDVISNFILNLGCNYIEKIDCFYARMDYLYHVEHGEKRYAIKFSKDDDLNEFYFVNKLRIQYEHLKKAVKNEPNFSPPQRIWALVAISKRFFQLKFNKEALSLIEETLELRKEVWGANHFETYDSWSRMASILCREKEYECALEIYQNVLLKRREIFQENEKPVLLTMYNLATVGQKQGAYESSLLQFEQIEKIVKEKGGIETSFLNDVLLGKATCFNIMNRIDKAIITYEEILKRGKEGIMVDDLKRPLILNNLAICLKKKNEFVRYYLFKIEAYLSLREIKGEDRMKKKELEDLFKENGLQKLFFEIFALKKIVKPLLKRKLIIEDILNHLI